MPSTSKKQHNFMAAIAKNPAFAKKVGIKQSVGEHFLTADKGKKFGTGGDVNYSYGGQNQINKQRTRFGSKFGYKLNAPDENLLKYVGKKEGGKIMAKKEMMHSEKSEMKSDLAQDKKMIKKAIAMHDKQEHPGKKTDLSALKKGGRIASKGEHAVQTKSKRGAEVVKMARGGGIEVRGKTKGKMVAMCGGGYMKKK